MKLVQSVRPEMHFLGKYSKKIWNFLMAFSMKGEGGVLRDINFLDALASLDLKLSVSEWVIHF